MRYLFSLLLACLAIWLFAMQMFYWGIAFKAPITEEVHDLTWKEGLIVLALMFVPAILSFTCFLFTWKIFTAI